MESESVAEPSYPEQPKSRGRVPSIFEAMGTQWRPAGPDAAQLAFARFLVAAIQVCGDNIPRSTLPLTRFRGAAADRYGLRYANHGFVFIDEDEPDVRANSQHPAQPGPAPEEPAPCPVQPVHSSPRVGSVAGSDGRDTILTAHLAATTTTESRTSFSMTEEGFRVLDQLEEDYNVWKRDHPEGSATAPQSPIPLQRYAESVSVEPPAVLSGPPTPAHSAVTTGPLTSEDWREHHAAVAERERGAAGSTAYPHPAF